MEGRSLPLQMISLHSFLKSRVIIHNISLKSVKKREEMYLYLIIQPKVSIIVVFLQLLLGLLDHFHTDHVAVLDNFLRLFFLFGFFLNGIFLQFLCFFQLCFFICLLFIKFLLVNYILLLKLLVFCEEKISHRFKVIALKLNSACFCDWAGNRELFATFFR